MRVLPRPDSGELEWLLFEQDDVISARQAASVMCRADLRRLVKSGRWTRQHWGIYLAHNGPITPEQQTWNAHPDRLSPRHPTTDVAGPIRGRCGTVGQI